MKNSISCIGLIILVILITASALTAAGCQATNTVSSNNPAVRPNAVDVSYKVNNPGLASDLKVLSAYEEMRNDLLFVQVNVRNEGAGELQYMWQASWFDNKGMKIPAGVTTWSRGFLQERQDGVIQFAAPTPNGVDWRLTLQRYEHKD